MNVERNVKFKKFKSHEFVFVVAVLLYKKSEQCANLKHEIKSREKKWVSVCLTKFYLNLKIS